jgi:hypothetical protein
MSLPRLGPKAVMDKIKITGDHAKGVVALSKVSVMD